MHHCLTRLLYILLLVTATPPAFCQQSIDRTQLMEYLQNQQYESAISYLQPRVADNNVSQLSLLGYTYYLSGRTKDAVTQYEKVLQLDSNNIPAHQYLATICLQMDAPQLAIPHYLEIIRLQPTNATAYKQLSFAGFAAQQQDSAFAWLQKAWLLNPADPKVTARLGEEWIAKEQYALADSILRAFLQKDSTQASVVMTAVRSAWFLKDYLRCTALGTQLMDMKVISPNTFSIVAAAWYTLKKYQPCINVYEYMQANRAQSENIMYYAALSYTALKNYEASNELLSACIDMATSKSLDSYYGGKSANYEGLHQYKAAVANLDTAFYLFHKPVRQYGIGRIYDVQLKNKPQAIIHYKRFMKTADRRDPQDAEIYKYLQSYVEK
ncbi:MAG: hypothetical protein J7623_24800 [Chitinophaga sp.]|uniref:tetratricopeptide repeat protein n=1 Tax=Chitinophaga sp. TaxID=1869181 RepID=UPI001B163AA1|nr:hypothetical protein [Chitinophaga sp.]MBO9731884.1 hypothetical protein [Chitinophaga sp.]